MPARLWIDFRASLRIGAVTRRTIPSTILENHEPRNSKARQWRAAMPVETGKIVLSLRLGHTPARATHDRLAP